jgi:tetrahydromethanopterin S-methyltransferase subunit B
LDTGAPRGLVLTILGRDHQSAVRICQQLHTRLDTFLGAIEGELANESLKYGEDPIKEAVNSLTAEAKALDQVLESVGAL